jgi:hypothetical protein
VLYQPRVILLAAFTAVICAIGPGTAQDTNHALDLAQRARSLSQYAEVNSEFLQLLPMEQQSALVRLKEVNENAYVFVLQSAIAAHGFTGPIDGQLTESSISAISAYCIKANIQAACALGPLDLRSAKMLAQALFPSDAEQSERPQPSSATDNVLATPSPAISTSREGIPLAIALPHTNSLVRDDVAAAIQPVSTEFGTGVQVRFEGTEVLYRVPFDEIRPRASYQIAFNVRVVTQSATAQRLVLDIGDSSETAAVRVSPGEWRSVTLDLSTDDDVKPWIDLQLRSPGSLLIELAALEVY